MRRYSQYLPVVSIMMAILFFSGCATYSSKVDNTAGRATVYSDPGTSSPMAGVGIESNDILSMCDKMMRSMLANPLLANPNRPPQIVVDAANFTNESANVINLNIITDRIRNGLLRAANGRMIFIGRHAAAMIEKEKKLKKSGTVDQGTTGYVAKTLGADYRLWGRITDSNAQSKTSGMQSRFTQIVFEMMDLQNGAIVWGDEFSFRKNAADDIIYR